MKDRLKAAAVLVTLPLGVGALYAAYALAQPMIWMLERVDRKDRD